MLDTSTGVVVMIALAVLIALTLAIILAFAMNPPNKTPTYETAERRRARAQRAAQIRVQAREEGPGQTRQLTGEHGERRPG